MVPFSQEEFKSAIEVNLRKWVEIRDRGYCKIPCGLCRLPLMRGTITRCMVCEAANVSGKYEKCASRVRRWDDMSKKNAQSFIRRFKVVLKDVGKHYGLLVDKYGEE